MHLYGQPVDMDPILAFAKEKGLPVIEDCAQSIGATYKGKQTGSLGTVNTTSFYPGKNLGAYGEGGAAMTNDPELAARMRRLRDHAQQGRHNHVEIGFNWRMDGFQGAVLAIKLAKLDAWNARRREIARIATSRTFEGLKGVRTLPEARLVGADLAHLPGVPRPPRRLPRARSRSAACRAASTTRRPFISSRPTPTSAYEGLAPPLGARGGHRISLPMFPELTDAQASEVIAAVKAVANELG